MINKLTERRKLFKNFNPNTFLLYTLVLVLISIIVTWGRADIQNRQLYQDYVRFETAKQLVQQAEFDDAEQELEILLPRYKNSHLVRLYYAICLEETGKYQAALRQFEIVYKICPAVAWQPAYLLYYGKCLFNTGDYRAAEKYMRKVIEIDSDKESTEQARQILKMIQDRGNGRNNGQ